MSSVELVEVDDGEVGDDDDGLTIVEPPPFLSSASLSKGRSKATEGLDRASARSDLRATDGGQRGRRGRAAARETETAVDAAADVDWPTEFTSTPGPRGGARPFLSSVSVTLRDLAVHSRKVADVRRWMEAASKDGSGTDADTRPSLLILSGPAGCGKRTMVSRGLGSLEDRAEQQPNRSDAIFVAHFALSLWLSSAPAVLVSS